MGASRFWAGLGLGGGFDGGSRHGADSARMDEACGGGEGER